MKVLIIGATRGIGAQLLDQALEAGHTVSVLVRNPSKIAKRHPNLTILRGDICDGASVNSAVHGQDVVCMTIGVPITFKPVTVFSKGAIEVIKAMEEHHVRRLICVTGIGAGNSKGHGGFLYDKIFNPLLLKTIYADKGIQEQYIMESGLDWVIVRPGRLTNGKRTGNYRVITDIAGITSTSISRADVADFIVSEITQNTYTGTTPLLIY
ncbi:NAD(P)-dependent oxidoreductase [Desulfosediminicola flagellatus]|uniref:NAD(P)-dependent oxidoreductase n=1 Tax=Desulfosediminicola flagellatus TaxID=2569541 RepID=UPI0010AC0971|nr:SDR family oxidoreductase [Desulfosediminicola flagellatus]